MRHVAGLRHSGEHNEHEDQRGHRLEQERAAGVVGESLSAFVHQLAVEHISAQAAVLILRHDYKEHQCADDGAKELCENVRGALGPANVLEGGQRQAHSRVYVSARNWARHVQQGQDDEAEREADGHRVPGVDARRTAAQENEESSREKLCHHLGNDGGLGLMPCFGAHVPRNFNVKS